MTFSNITEIEELVAAKTSESLTLEFKRAAALGKTSDARREIVKDVTAMANAAGGVIIYGIREDSGCASEIDHPGVDLLVFPPEWLGAILETNASPRVQGIQISALRLEGNFGIYVLTIPQAIAFAPHQCSLDQKYYRRSDQRAVPMHDYEIRDILRRRESPNIEARLSFADDSLHSRLQSNRSFFLKVTVENFGIEPSLYTYLGTNIDNNLTITGYGSWHRRNLLKEIGDYRLIQLDKTLMVPKDFPLVSGSNITFGPPDIILTIPDEVESRRGYLLGTTVLAPGCKRDSFYTLVVDAADNISLHKHD